MALESKVNGMEAARIVLEEYEEGVYVLAFKKGEDWPYRDMLQDNWEMAKLEALEDYGVSNGMFRDIPDTGIMK